MFRNYSKKDFKSVEHNFQEQQEQYFLQNVTILGFF